MERQRPRPAQSGQVRGPGFSFFGRGTGSAVRAAAPAPAVGSIAELGERADLADVVGDEALAAKAKAEAQEAREDLDVRESTSDVRPAQPVGSGDAEQDGPTVVDLTPEDETELIELPELRASR
ncbi:hypothetical protein HS99_0028865 [Kitasatospora aureofaciens]|uniref:Uncharacterized protein n=1 Tax=Kitasatospora aureofaciens TaxID=1894 RepID=A0A1E7N764_KITAU|nr:hypothetical protein HS99_0028865 [Kitasatospora aureofaciens]